MMVEERCSHSEEESFIEDVYDEDEDDEDEGDDKSNWSSWDDE